MSKFVITTALALVLAGGAFAQGHHGGGGGGGPGRGPSMMSRGPSSPSGFSSNRGPSGMQTFKGSEFSRNNRGPEGRTLYNQERGNRYVNRDMDRGRNRTLYNKYNDHEQYGEHKGDHERNMDFRHSGVVRGDFSEHGRHFRFRRFWHAEWVFLNDWNDCTAWAWIHIAPGVWAWRPIDVCIG